MSAHVSETCNESDGLWLPLTEFSVRSGVSLSTIRRKIKSNSIRYRLEKGRYLILVNEATNAAVRMVPQAPVPAYAPEVSLPEKKEVRLEGRREAAEDLPLAERTARMISDAFEHALREKDERIGLLEKANRLLEDRLNELRLLVRVLEEKYEVRY